MVSGQVPELKNKNICILQQFFHTLPWISTARTPSQRAEPQRFKIFGLPAYTHISRSKHTTPLLRELHWLKVPERIQFRLCVLTLRCLCSIVPPYTLLRCFIGRLMWLHVAVSGLLRRRHWSYRWHVDPPSATARFWWLRLVRGILCRHPSRISSRSLRSARNWSWPCLATPLPAESSILWTVSHVYTLVLYGAPATVYCDSVTLILACIIIIIIIRRRRRRRRRRHNVSFSDSL